jgi:hypothetical protein
VVEEMTRIALGILDGYAVQWKRETVVRDLVQNFFDETPDFADVAIEIDDARRTVRIAGPSRFDADYLRYLGASTKRERRAAGGFGEGFKICALVLLRDYGAGVRAGSGSWALRAVLADMKLGRELCYDVDSVATYDGSFVEIEGADARLREAFGRARELFRWPGNPRLQTPIFTDDASGLGLYEAKHGYRAEVFYRRQLRGRARFAAGGGIVIAHDAKIAALEHDRDRRDLRALPALYAAAARGVPDDVLRALILRLRRYWQRGHGLLAALAREAARREIRIDPPPRWLAKTRKTPYGLDAHAERTGYRVASSALAAIGVPTIESVLAADLEPRAPAPLEHARFELARAIYRELAPGDPAGERALRVLDAGSADRHVDYQHRTIVVRAEALAAPFEAGVVRCLSALARVGGGKSATDGDRMTRLLEAVLDDPRRLARYAGTWDTLARDLDALPPPLEDDAVDPDTALVARIFAPPGLPAADVIEARVREIARARRIPITIERAPVCGPRGAESDLPRGIPGLVIGARDVGGGRRRGYFPAAPIDDGAITAALDAEAAVLRRERAPHPFLARFLRDRKIARRAEERDPALAAARARRETFERVWSAERRETREVGDSSAWYTIASAMFDAGPGDEVAAQAAIDAARARVDDFCAWASEAGLGEVTRVLARDVEVCAPERRAAWVPLFASFDARLEASGLDAQCARGCANVAMERAYGGHFASADPGDGARALAELDDTITFAHARHARRDAWGAPLPCHTLATDLPLRDGKTRAELAAEEQAMIAACVRAAWDAALVSGADPLPAALAAALPFDDPG